MNFRCNVTPNNPRQRLRNFSLHRYATTRQQRPRQNSSAQSTFFCASYFFKFNNKFFIYFLSWLIFVFVGKRCGFR
jgi:hypothetical protein